jgi:TolB-like protein
VLHPDLAASIGAERFLREIRIAARLQHPHILALYDSGEVDGLLYYVMPYVTGASLRTLLARETPLSVESAVRIARQVADALAYAHAQGVVHRDIKPENILLADDASRDSHALVADFGIARAVDRGGAGALTEAGLVVGTPTYMSPEQALGEQHVDGRADVFALGCVLHEMLTGTAPFAGPSAQVSIARRLTEPPPPVRRDRPEVSASIESALLCALAREPGDRFATMSAFVTALSGASSVRSGTSGAPELSIVVLPFVNTSADPENEYFSDGLTEELIADLSHVGALRVISRTSAMRLKGTDRDIRTIGRHLDVAYALEGSVRKIRNDVRITAQLVDAVADKPVWSEKFAGTLDDVFGIQERVSRAIVDALRLRLAPDEERRMRERPIRDTRAWECYLRARHDLNRFTPESIERALALLREGERLVGENALLIGLTGYAQLLTLRLHLGPKKVEAAEAEAEACARRVRELDPASPYGPFLDGMLAYGRGDVQRAVRELKATLERDPNHVESLYWIAICLFYVGRSDAARAYARRLLAIDPLTSMNVGLLGGIDVFDGRLEEGIRSAETFHDKEPDHPLAIWGLGYFLALAGRMEESHVLARRLETMAPGWVYSRQLLALHAAADGDVASALQWLSGDLAHEAERDAHLSLHLAEPYALIGHADDALDAIDTGVRRGFFPYPFLRRHARFLAPLQGNPRFEAILERARSAWESFEA